MSRWFLPVLVAGVMAAAGLAPAYFLGAQAPEGGAGSREEAEAPGPFRGRPFRGPRLPGGPEEPGPGERPLDPNDPPPLGGPGGGEEFGPGRPGRPHPGPGGPGPGGPPRGPHGLGPGPRGPHGPGGPFDWDRLRERDPEMYELHQRDLELERACHELSEEYARAGEARREDIREELNTLVGEHFEVRQQRRTIELERLEKELSRLRESIEARQDAREMVIERRLKELLGETDPLDF